MLIIRNLFKLSLAIFFSFFGATAISALAFFFYVVSKVGVR